ncbi:MAG: IS1595 family transposase [Candidatus Methylumidiphilus sp.]
MPAPARRWWATAAARAGRCTTCSPAGSGRARPLRPLHGRDGPLRGFAQGVPTLQLADELGCDYGTLLNYRHEMQAAALLRRDATPRARREREADEAFQNAGEKGGPHRDPGGAPRRRANQRKGRGTMANDRPPVMGVAGRESGQIRLAVCDDTRQDTIQPEVEAKTDGAATLNTDESPAYNRVGASGRGHRTVCHSAGEYARDDDGDGIRETHCNTMEGIWTGLRNFLRPFRGVHKKIPCRVRRPVRVGAKPQARGRPLARNPPDSQDHLFAHISATIFLVLQAS